MAPWRPKACRSKRCVKSASAWRAARRLASTSCLKDPSSASSRLIASAAAAAPCSTEVGQRRVSGGARGQGRVSRPGRAREGARRAGSSHLLQKVGEAFTEAELSARVGKLLDLPIPIVNDLLARCEPLLALRWLLLEGGIEPDRPRRRASRAAAGGGPGHPGGSQRGSAAKEAAERGASGRGARRRHGTEAAAEAAAECSCRRRCRRRTKASAEEATGGSGRRSGGAEEATRGSGGSSGCCGTEEATRGRCRRRSAKQATRGGGGRGRGSTAKAASEGSGGGSPSGGAKEAACGRSGGRGSSAEVEGHRDRRGLPVSRTAQCLGAASATRRRIAPPQRVRTAWQHIDHVTARRS